MSKVNSLAIMQPYVFPYLGYFQLIHAVDKFVFLDDVNFIKKGWINRNNILLNGKASRLSIPVSKASQNELIKDLFVSEEGKWRSKLLNSLAHAYKKAPFYKERIGLITNIIEQEGLSIADFAKNSITTIAKELGLDTEFVPSSSIYSKDSYGAQRILDICKANEVKKYINPQGGVDLYEEEDFSKEGITLNFLHMDSSLEYAQLDNQEFVPSLSIIDVLMFNSNDEIQELLKKYQLE